MQCNKPRGPTILMTRRSDRGSYFIPQKTPTSEFVYPKKSLLFLAYPKKSHTNSNLCLCYCWSEVMKTQYSKKIPVVLLQPKKIIASFIDPKKSLSAKMSNPKKSSDPPPISKICEGAPGVTNDMTSSIRIQFACVKAGILHLVSTTCTFRCHEWSEVSYPYKSAEKKVKQALSH